MEVHHHAHISDPEPSASSGYRDGPDPHRSRKKWTHYFWEFLMLFFAVFCGFLAENIREHNVERHREKQYIKSLVEDLSEDTITLSRAIGDISPNVQRMDTLVNLLSSADVMDRGADLYYFGRRASRGTTLALNDRTIQQMKNSGGFRLISKTNVSKVILEYYNRLRFIELLFETEMNECNEYRKMAVAIFDPVIFDGTVTPDNSIVKPEGNPSLLTSDRTALLQLAGMVSYIKSTRIGLIIAEEKLRIAAKNLIRLLIDEYHLE